MSSRGNLLTVFALTLSHLGGSCADAESSPGSVAEEPPVGSPDDARRPPGFEDLTALGYAGDEPVADERRRGVTLYDVERACPGYNLFSNNVDRVYLMDMHGERLRSWSFAKGVVAPVLLPDGDLVAIETTRGLFRRTWDDEVVWSVDGPFHHDIGVLADGSFVVPMLDEVREHNGWSTYFDDVARVSPEGEILERWSLFDHLESFQALHPPLYLDQHQPTQEHRGARIDYYHVNATQPLPETDLGARDPRFRAQNLILSLRNANQIAILDGLGPEVVWHWGADTLDRQHMPVMLDSGNILVFDNGYLRGWSQVLEVKPVSGEVVWRYQGDPRESFFSKYQGSAQRLPNGNTLICDSWAGHAFEVTHEGTPVWEYWLPEIRDRIRGQMYRFVRLEPGFVDAILERVGDVWAPHPSSATKREAARKPRAANVSAE